MAQSLELLLFNHRLRKNISTYPNQANLIDHPTSYTPSDNTPPNLAANTPRRNRSRRKNTKPLNNTYLPLDTSSVVNLSNVTLANDETQLLARRLIKLSVTFVQVICGLSLLLVLSLAPRVFLRVLRFSSLRKNQHSKFQFDTESVDE